MQTITIETGATPLQVVFPDLITVITYLDENETPTVEVHSEGDEIDPTQTNGFWDH